MNYDSFKEYIREYKLDKRDKGYAWHTAIGLQAVVHRKLFTGIYTHAGCVRNYNITKKEWVLDGATVLYGSATELRSTLDYDFSEKRKFSYRNLSMDKIIHHLAVFISRLWQIHVFGDGNVTQRHQQKAA